MTFEAMAEDWLTYLHLLILIPPPGRRLRFRYFKPSVLRSALSFSLSLSPPPPQPPMSFLPDEIWIKILEMGATAAQLGFRDLCSLAITCRRLNRLSGDPSLWSIVLSLDFPESVSSSSSPLSPSKSLYRNRFEKDKARRIAAWRRRVLFAESHMALSRKRLEELECQLRFEGERMKEALEELRNLERIRQASVALNVWQPEIVHGRQRQIVEQCTVPIESRRNNLYMEINLCKQQIATYNKAYNKQKQLVKDNDELLSSLKYRPLDAHHLCESSNENGFKRKKLKSSSSELL